MGEKTIWVIDDNSFIVDMILDILKSLGIQKTYTFRNPVLAQEFLQQSKNVPNCIFSDIEMPKMSGLEFVEWLQSSGYGDIPIVIMSGYIDSDKKKKIKELGIPSFEKIFLFDGIKLNIEKIFE